VQDEIEEEEEEELNVAIGLEEIVDNDCDEPKLL